MVRKKLSSDFKGVSGHAALSQPAVDASSVWSCKFHDKYLCIPLSSYNLAYCVCIFFTRANNSCSNKPAPLTLIKLHFIPSTYPFPSVAFPSVYCISLKPASCQMQAKASLHLFILPLLSSSFNSLALCLPHLCSICLLSSEPRSSLWGWPVKVN